MPDHVRVSEEETAYAVVCQTNITGGPGCGRVFLTEAEYERQMLDANRTWRCPSCGNDQCYWDDDHHEKYMGLRAVDE